MSIFASIGTAFTWFFIALACAILITVVSVGLAHLLIILFSLAKDIKRLVTNPKEAISCSSISWRRELFTENWTRLSNFLVTVSLMLGIAGTAVMAKMQEEYGPIGGLTDLRLAFFLYGPLISLVLLKIFNVGEKLEKKFFKPKRRLPKATVVRDGQLL